MRSVRRLLLALATACLACGGARPADAAELPEMQLKAAFLYNFAVFTEWPPETGPTVTLCVLDGSGFQGEFEEFLRQPVGSRHFGVRQVRDFDALQNCQMAFVPRAAVPSMARSRRTTASHHHLLTIGDSQEAAQAGVGINLVIKDAHVNFDVNTRSVQDAGLTLSSKLMRLARHVR